MIKKAKKNTAETPEKTRGRVDIMTPIGILEISSVPELYFYSSESFAEAENMRHLRELNDDPLYSVVKHDGIYYVILRGVVYDH